MLREVLVLHNLLLVINCVLCIFYVSENFKFLCIYIFGICVVFFFFFVEADDLTQHITGYNVIDRAQFKWVKRFRDPPKHNSPTRAIINYHQDSETEC